VHRGRDAFNSDEDLQLAMVRLLEIIGEACARTSADLQGQHPEVAWRDAARLRNRITHGYFDVDLSIVWRAAADEVPSFAAAVRRILDDLPPEDDR
jgi:uncharacterized protein with HEPN domain